MAESLSGSQRECRALFYWCLFTCRSDVSCAPAELRSRRTKDRLPTGTPEPYNFTSASFNLAVDTSGKFLYFPTHATCANEGINPACTMGNAMYNSPDRHRWQTRRDDGIANDLSPSVVPDNTHPKGLAFCNPSPVGTTIPIRAVGPSGFALSRRHQSVILLQDQDKEKQV